MPVSRLLKNLLSRLNKFNFMLVYPLFIGWQELLLIAVVFLLLFGAKRIPDVMKSLGKGMKSFKEGLNEIDDQTNSADKDNK